MTGQAEAKVHAAMAGKADTDTSGQLLQTAGPVQKSSGALKEAAIGRAFSNAFSMGVALMLVLLLVMAGLNYQNNRQFNEDANWVAQTHEVQTLASNIVLALVDAETGQRGFVTTGNTAFLQSYDAALVRLWKLRVRSFIDAFRCQTFQVLQLINRCGRAQQTSILIQFKMI